MPAYVASDKFLFKCSILFTYLARINSFLICHTDETGEVIGLPFNRRIARENHAALDPVDTVAATIVRLATIHHIHVETTPIYLIYIYSYNDQEEELYQVTAILSRALVECIYFMAPDYYSHSFLSTDEKGITNNLHSFSSCSFASGIYIYIRYNSIII